MVMNAKIVIKTQTESAAYILAYAIQGYILDKEAEICELQASFAYYDPCDESTHPVSDSEAKELHKRIASIREEIQIAQSIQISLDAVEIVFISKDNEKNREDGFYKPILTAEGWKMVKVSADS